MAINARLKEERQRLGLSQAAFASLAGVTKSAQLKWESGASSSPTAPALAAWAEAGADVLYIVTGRRLPELTDGYDEWIRDDLDEIERELIDPSSVRLPGESLEQAETRLIEKAKKRLRTVIDCDARHLPNHLIDRALALMEAALDPHRLSLLRAADFAQGRVRRDSEKEILNLWFDQLDYSPDHPVVDMMARIIMDFGVPHRTLVELANEIHKDIEEQQSAERIIRLNDKSSAP